MTTLPAEQLHSCRDCFRRYQLALDRQVVREHWASPFDLMGGKCAGSLQPPDTTGVVIHLVSGLMPPVTTLCCSGRPAKLPVFHRYTVDKSRATCPGTR